MILVRKKSHFVVHWSVNRQTHTAKDESCRDRLSPVSGGSRWHALPLSVPTPRTCQCPQLL